VGGEIMAKVIEPLKSDQKLVQEFTSETKRVLLIFWHGLGDLIMFLNPFMKLRELYPDIQFDLAVQKGLSFEDIVPWARFITGEDMNTLETLDYDIVAKVHFPMSEDQTDLTKGEFCCVHELGIAPVNGHRLVKTASSRLIGVHFNITCLPDACNPDEATAKLIWDEIREAGFIPIETHFEHVFHNPVNKKFDFVDCSVRRAQARISNLISLTSGLAGFVGVVSGNLHLALAILPSNRIFFLQKHFKLECFTRLPVVRASIIPGEYKPGEIKKWLETLEGGENVSKET
jgi:hypothetical protein